MFDLMPWKKRGSSEVTRFRSELDNLFDRFFDLDFPSTRDLFKESGWFPSVDISEGKKEITVKAEIPGVEAKDIDIALDGRRLTIKGEKKQEKEEKEENLHRVERSYGYFNRTVELPTEVDPGKVDAAYKKGVLTIVMKKTKEAEAKKIEVKTAS
jgi:HSP20 family protein